MTTHKKDNKERIDDLEKHLARMDQVIDHLLDILVKSSSIQEADASVFKDMLKKDEG